MSIEKELREFDAALRLPVVGQPNRDRDMFTLAQLIERYPEEARQMLADRDADTR